MTSNVGSQYITEINPIGYTKDQVEKQLMSHEFQEQKVLAAAKKAFPAEFLNRPDGIIVFNALDKESIGQILDLKIKDVDKQMQEGSHHLKLQPLSPEVKDFLIEKGFDPQLGARPMNRAIQKHLEDPIADGILDGSLRDGQTVKATLKDGKLALSEVSLLPVPYVYSQPKVPINNLTLDMKGATRIGGSSDSKSPNEEKFKAA
jgi:ATP-dependent Clp protease ATP-binding subunit ClpC